MSDDEIVKSDKEPGLLTAFMDAITTGKTARYLGTFAGLRTSLQWILDNSDIEGNVPWRSEVVGAISCLERAEELLLVRDVTCVEPPTSKPPTEIPEVEKEKEDK